MKYNRGTILLRSCSFLEITLYYDKAINQKDDDKGDNRNKKQKSRRRKFMKKLISVAVALMLAVMSCFSFAACAGNNDENTLKIGITDYKPMDYKEEGSDEWIGFDADLAKEVCKILGYKAEFVEIDWNSKVMAINSKEIDVIWNGMTITDELRESLLISQPYLENKQVIVCQKGEAEKYATKEDLLKAGTILVEAGSAGENTVKAIAGAEAKMLGASAQKDTLLEVKTSASKIAVIDKLLAQVAVGEGTSFSDLTMVDVGFENEQFGIGFRKNDSALMEKVENAIAQLKENGTYARLQNKYFG